MPHHFYPYLVNKLSPNLYVIIERQEPLFEDWGRTFYVNSMQLVIGEKRAALIDTGYGYGDLPQLVRDYTDLPVDLLITHSSYDHWRGSYQFEGKGEIYMHEADYAKIKDRMSELKLDFHPKPLNDGDVFDLGGIKLESILVQGHTAGSIVFFDRTHNYLYTGDAVNLLPWVFSGTVPLSEYCIALKRLRDMTPGQPAVLCGHAWDPHPYQILLDSITACEEVIVSGGEGDPQYRAPWEPNGRIFPNAYMHQVGRVRLCYNKTCLK
ncbi:MAG: MBL fold metallo-hydrolase [Oscillospiraceae bacterium]|nr:MBL fold metallo-hydrolase [Oscillospiraceae bacterium]